MLKRKKGVLLINTGTPDSPSPHDVRRYLARFLSDKRIIKVPRVLWWPILHGMILPFRPYKSGKLYQKVWTKKGSPLAYFALRQNENLKKLLPDVEIETCMSYSHPLIDEGIDRLLGKGVEQLTIIPLYPQYSGTTSGASFDNVVSYFYGNDKIIDLKFIHSFYQHPKYIAYYASKIKEKLSQNNYNAILFSYHGIPESYVKSGDTYPKQCQETTQLIMEKVGDFPYYQSYQSKFGPGKWLTPATSKMLMDFPNKGIKKILVCSPGFVADCLETIYEIDIENRAYFKSSGGELFEYIHPFNEAKELAEILLDYI
ncbi:ferrochelatase [Ligilactobacillus sp. WILCCON 0076]|uniref:Coproporphyrin III ferrochelatase n=1 Tax=Ligilactobacillus ubinensis TaxID=2876789 RepID=A0A9X2JLN6_9LACO|nr:ferrochelatase [Ligilactobacillus ubinensis]MCP0886800.1 ferrochelatase [Ligilactobacillus ubinensis]